MATHSSVLAWRIPGTGEPGGLPSVGSHRGGHDWSDLAAAAAEAQSISNSLKDPQPLNSGARVQTQDSLTSENKYLTRKAYMCYLYFDLPK